MVPLSKKKIQQKKPFYLIIKLRVADHKGPSAIEKLTIRWYTNFSLQCTPIVIKSDHMTNSHFLCIYFFYFY